MSEKITNSIHNRSLNPEVSEQKPILVAKSFVLSLASSSKTASKSEAPKAKAGSTKPAFESADQEDTVDSKEHLSVVFVGYIMDNRTMGKKMEKIQRKPGVNHGTFLRLWEKESSQYDLMYFKADAGALAVSACKSEFKIDFECGGQTRKHMIPGKVFGISKLIVTVSKMDGLLSHCMMG
ncbi:hypothetical protein G6F37_010784 [Rhizopus arrhizus]|nr:hypothetical protein G6F38_010846 [Rhizopus arrhizus]KAG1152494.1 hypothetical protein G6F37_010784 [Rhizopus arrhizus]